MKSMRFLLAMVFLMTFAALAQAKESKKTQDTQPEQARQEFVQKLGSQTAKLNAKEIPQGFIFESGKGKVTLLVLWTKDCKSCVDDIPNLNRILLDFRGKVNIIAIEISGMTSKQLQEYAKDKKVLYTMVSGVENKKFVARIMEKFGFDKSLPFQIVLGYTGHNNGIIKGIAKVDDMEKFLQKIIRHYEEKKTVKPIGQTKQKPAEKTDKPKKRNSNQSESNTKEQK